MKLKSLSQRFLEGLAEAVDSLSSGTNPALFNPTIAVISALILTGTAAFSYGFKLSALIFAVSVVLVLLTRSPICTWAKILMFILTWATLVSIPVPFITLGAPLANLSLGSIELKVSREGLNAMITFISRVVAAAAIFTSFVSIMGWERIVRGLGGLQMPRELTLLLNLSIIHIPLFLREASMMLSAREARIMRKTRFKDVWRVLATVVGDLLLRSYERAWRLEKAIRSRSFTSTGFLRITPPAKIGAKDLLLFSLTLCILTLGVLGGL